MMVVDVRLVEVDDVRTVGSDVAGSTKASVARDRCAVIASEAGDVTLLLSAPSVKITMRWRRSEAVGDAAATAMVSSNAVPPPGVAALIALPTSFVSVVK